MGKESNEEDQQPPGTTNSSEGETSVRRSCGKRVSWRCAGALLLSAAVLLSALFWLPPFSAWHHRRDRPDADATVGADIVASFRLQRTVAQLKENISRLEYDIYAEVGSPGTIVSVTSLEALNATINGSDYTTVIFCIFPYPKNTVISPTWISIIRSKFMALVVRQSTLEITEPLFGNSSFFEVVRFPGGITIIPEQSAFLLQKPHAFFNFTLNFPIWKVQDEIEELKEQMKQGLYLNSYENLFIKLTNLNGSTLNPPTVVQTSIVLEVGNHQPSHSRLRQLAQTITNSSSSHSNLGLNHTTFGRVKQVSLSSYLRHSLTSGPHAPSPAPVSQPPHHHHHHHHRPHVNPVHAPGPSLGSPKPPPPSGCGSQRTRNDSNSVAGNRAAPPVAPPPRTKEGYPHNTAPSAGTPPPLAGVSFEHVNPPSESEASENGRDWKLPPSPSPSPVPNSCHASHVVRLEWLMAPILYLLFLLLRLL